MIYRSKLHATLKRNFQLMPGVQWLELLCKHVPDRHEHMVRCYDRYSSPARSSEHERPDVDEPGPEAESQARRAVKIAWAKMIRKVYEVDPLTCPQCGARMHEFLSLGLYALENNVERLALDHEHAAKLAAGLRELGLEVQHNTNMVLAQVPAQKA